MLICRQLKVALENLGDLPQTRLEVLLRFVLHTAVLDEGSVVVSTILTSDPTELVDIAGEFKRPSGLEAIPKSLFNFGLEVLEPHPVNSVLQPGVLAASGTLANTALQTVATKNVLCTVTVVSLNQHDFLRHVFTLLHCAETKDIGSSGIRLLVSMGYTHSTSSGDIESGEFTVLIHNRNEANIIGEDIDVVRRGDGYGNFELRVYV